MHEYGSTFILLNLIVLIVTCRIKKEITPYLLVYMNILGNAESFYELK